MRTILILTFLISSAQAATSTNYRQQIESLNVSEDDVPDQTLQERLYAVQSRALPLRGRFELKIAGGQNFAGNGFLQTRQVGLGGQYHLNDNWSLGAQYSQVSNEFSNSAEGLYKADGKLPDVDFAKSRMEAFVDYNLFYGKMRFTRDSIWYFDQYVGLGAAQHELQSGSSMGALAHVGFVFWIAKMSARIELTDYFYKETSRTSSGSNHNIHGSVGLGYVF